MHLSTWEINFLNLFLCIGFSAFVLSRIHVRPTQIVHHAAKHNWYAKKTNASDKNSCLPDEHRSWYHCPHTPFFFTSFEFFRYSSPNWKSTCNSHLFYNVEYILCLPPYLNIFTFRTSQSFHTQHICLPFCAKFVKQSSKNIYGLVRLRRYEDIKIISWWLNYESYLVVFRHKIDRIQLFPLRMKFFRKFVFLESLFNQSNIIQVTRVSQGRFIFKATVALAYE